MSCPCKAGKQPAYYADERFADNYYYSDGRMANQNPVLPGSVGSDGTKHPNMVEFINDYDHDNDQNEFGEPQSVYYNSYPQALPGACDTIDTAGILLGGVILGGLGALFLVNLTGETSLFGIAGKAKHAGSHTYHSARKTIR